MRILVAYFSQTGNTEKVARAIYEEALKGNDAEMKKLADVGPAEAAACDLLFAGTPCHAGDLSGVMKAFIDGLPDAMNCTFAGFLTHAATLYRKDDYEKCIRSYTELCGKKKIRLLGCFDCQGFLNPDIHEMVKKMKKLSDDEWLERVEQMKGHPDEEDLRRAREFANTVIKQMK